jgi:hypothetical protein
MKIKWSKGLRGYTIRPHACDVGMNNKAVTTRGLSDTKRLVDTSGVLNVTAKYAALRGRCEERALDRDEAAGWALMHDVVEQSDGLENSPIVISSTAEVGVEGCEVNNCSKVDNQWRASRQDEPR